MARLATIGDIHYFKASQGMLQPLFAHIAESADVLIIDESQVRLEIWTVLLQCQDKPAFSCHLSGTAWVIQREQLGPGIIFLKLGKKTKATFKERCQLFASTRILQLLLRRLTLKQHSIRHSSN